MKNELTKNETFSTFWTELEVIEVIQETARSVSLVLENTKSPDIVLYYQAGQHINVMLQINKQQVARSYSISSAPYEETIKLTIQSLENGIASHYINNTIAAGDKIMTRPPLGQFTIKNNQNDYIGIAAGSGITPIISMIKHHLYSTNRHCYLLYFSRSPDDTIFLNEISQLCRTHYPRLVVKHWYSSAQGRFNFTADTAAILGNPLQNKPDIYLCGPTKWMDKLQNYLSKYITDLGSIYRESFIDNDTIELPPSEALGAAYSVEVRLGGTAQYMQAKNGETILAAAERHAIPIPSGCRQGKCGSCMGLILEGEVERNNVDFLLPDEIDQGIVLCCNTSVSSNCIISFD